MTEYQHNDPKADSATTAIARCGQCGAAGFPEDRFCPCCGAPMNRYCPSCGASIIHAMSLFCTNCGASLRGQGAPSGTTQPPT
ncbi:MAG: zinc ribbon domain-containing protein [Chlorobi bacterium]|nr:zinc ribbon domain-containing protein [Chlorobiota bacterium]